MDQHRQPNPSRKGFFGALIPTAAWEQHQAFQQSLEPDPGADEITRIDQQWIKQCTTLTAIDDFGMLQAPNMRMLLALIGGIVALIAGLLAFAGSNGGAYCFVGFFFLFFLLPLLLALFQTRNYFAAARDYRRRRAEALAARGQRDDRPLPVIDRPVWVGAGTRDPRLALSRLDEAYRAGRVQTANYHQIRATYLQQIPADQQAADQPGGDDWQRRW